MRCKPKLPPHYHHPIRGICRWCNKPIVENGAINRRKLWHKECIEPGLFILQPSHAAFRVFERDCGICQACKLDVGQLERDLQSMRTQTFIGKTWKETQEQFDAKVAAANAGIERIWHELLSRGFSQRSFQKALHGTGRLWQMDHVQPIWKSKGELRFFEPANCQLLCLACHAMKTKIDTQDARACRTNGDRLEHLHD